MPPRQKLRNYTQSEWRRINQDLDESEHAIDRIGSDPEKRLRWVLRFVAEDLSNLRPEEKVARGYDLRLFLALGWSIRRRYAPLPEKQVERIQKEVARGLSRSWWRRRLSLLVSTLGGELVYLFSEKQPNAPSGPKRAQFSSPLIEPHHLRGHSQKFRGVGRAQKHSHVFGLALPYSIPNPVIYIGI